MIRYFVRVDDAPSHYAAVRIAVPRPGPGPVDLVLPAWVPGSYMIQDPARFVYDLTARTVDGATALPVERLEKGRWRIGGEGDIEVRYRVYGHSATTEGLDVDEEHLFFTGVFCLPYVDGRKDEPCELAVEPRPGHRIVTELEPIGEHPPTFRAPDYDELADAVVDVGTPTVVSIAPHGIPHRLSLCGRGGNFDPHRYGTDVGKVVDATIRYMGDSPLKGYTFFHHLGEAYDGALEHLASNSCVVPWNWFRPEKSYQRMLSLASHEYFHLYNVKRIHPEVLGPFDYTREVYTKLLWLMEGTTDYVSLLMLRYGGLASPAKYLERVAAVAKDYYDTPGRHHQSLESASQLAWIDYYRKGEETVNRSISYYVKGNLVSLCLDLELRRRTEGRRSLRDVMRYLWSEYGRPRRGIAEGSFPAIVERATGETIEEFARRYIAGTDELDLDAFVRSAGLSYGEVPRSPEEADEGEPGYLGVETRVVEGNLRVLSVRDGTPGRNAGLSPGDDLVAIDGARIPPREFAELLKRFPPGSEAEVTVFRKGWLTKVPVAFGRAPAAKTRFVARGDATAAEKALYEGWIGASWEPPKPSEAAGKPSA